MNAFIIPVLIFNLDAPYFNFAIQGTFYEQYINITADVLEVGVSFNLYIYLEHEIGREDTIFDEDKYISLTYDLELQENYDQNYVAKIETNVYLRNIEYIQTYDSATLTIDYETISYAFDRSNSVLAIGQQDGEIRLYEEMNFDIPYTATYTPLFDYVGLQKEIRGFSHDEIYQSGYNDGYHDGEQEGYENGYYDGYEEGEYYGSMTQPIFKLFNAVFRTIDNVLQTEILPGIKLWYLVSIPLVFLIIQFFINLWR